MLDAELQKLTAAIEALTVQIKNQNVSKAGTDKHADAAAAHAEAVAIAIAYANGAHITAKQPNRNGALGSVTGQDNRNGNLGSATAQQIAGGRRTVRKINDIPTPLDPHPTTSKENLKDLALQISRADSNAKSEIVSILNSHGAKTITSLSDDPGALHDVFVRLTNLAAKIAEQSQ
tara:strand:+ start:915 stop:1442 length:528 start_codon:yes stop_codon:yes gene_type:complete